MPLSRQSDRPSKRPSRRSTVDFFCGVTVPSGPGSPHYRSHSVGLLWTSDQPDLTLHNAHKRKTCILPAQFETAIPTSEMVHTHAAQSLGSAKRGIERVNKGRNRIYSVSIKSRHILSRLRQQTTRLSC